MLRLKAKPSRHPPSYAAAAAPPHAAAPSAPGPAASAVSGGMSVCKRALQTTHLHYKGCTPSGVQSGALLLLPFAALHAPAPPHCLQHRPAPGAGVTEQIYGLRNEMYTYTTGWRKWQPQSSPCHQDSYDSSRPSSLLSQLWLLQIRSFTFCSFEVAKVSKQVRGDRSGAFCHLPSK